MRSLVAMLVVFVAVQGCLSQGCLSADFQIPADALIRCESERECPAGYVCPASLQVCIEPSTDVVAPAFVAGTQSVTPVAVNGAGTITAVFEVTESLAELPVVRIERPGDTDAMFELTGSSPPEYTYTYEVAGDEPEQLYQVWVDLVDEVGNAVTLAVGEVTIDFTAPVLVGNATVSPTTAGCTCEPNCTACDTLTLTFVASELLAKADVTLGNAPAGRWTLGAVDGVSYTFTYVLTGDEPEGTAAIQLELTDLAGNVADVAGGNVTIDHYP